MSVWQEPPVFRIPDTWLYTLMGTFITLLTLFEPTHDDGSSARHVPIASSYENLSQRPLNVGGKLLGSLIEYESRE